MPTRDRRSFVGQAIRYFLRQDYEPRELLVLDDGRDQVADLIPADERVRYVRLEPGLTLGAKRNLGCQLSRGQLIAHWDDDDWMAPWRLSAQVHALLTSGAGICGVWAPLHYVPARGEAWRYRPDAGEPGVAGATLLYRKSVWVARPFAEVDAGEDSSFLAGLPAGRVHGLEDASCYVTLIHGQNTTQQDLRDPRWEQRPLDEIDGLLAADRDFYVALRNGHPVDQARPAPTTSITLAAPLLTYDGYGSMAQYLALGMARAGASVNIAPLQYDGAGLSAEMRRLIEGSHPHPTDIVLYDSWICPTLESYRTSARELFIHTMWEGSRLPAGWAEQLNGARAVLVPSRFVARVCRDSGVTVPVEVVPDGIDPALYRYQQRPPRQGLTTLIVGTMIPRKHVAEGVAAWRLAFAGDPDARLIVKSRFGSRSPLPADSRIRIVDSNEPTAGIVHWYREADALLALGSEGFGLPLIEGMATGLPVIALNSEGQADVCTDAPDYLLPVPPDRWEPVREAPWGPGGMRGIPAVADVVERLRWVAEHREEARQMGRAASEWVRQHRDVWRKGTAVLDVLERHADPKRPLWRARTLWVPSWRTPCGVAEYSAYLARALPPGVRVTSTVPSPAGLWLLHVQHQDALFDDASLTRELHKVRDAGVPVVVTAHSVSLTARSWEAQADALVTMTPGGTRELRARHLELPVHYLPHGCPTWFPPRKRSRDRVVGAFGFLAPHKGFWRLLDVLRQVRGSELLLFSHPTSAEMGNRWKEATAGLPVRHVTDFLPVEEIARRLAAEADVLAFPYDEAPLHTTSGAVRVALASGVPVLTSPTAWFAGLQEVTYQPEELVTGVRRLLDDTALRERITGAAREYCHQNSWKQTAQRHIALWDVLDAAKHGTEAMECHSR